MPEYSQAGEIIPFCLVFISQNSEFLFVIVSHGKGEFGSGLVFQIFPFVMRALCVPTYVVWSF